MPQGCRLHSVALRGWLILVLVLLSSVLSAQQETKEAKPPVIQNEGAAKEAPPPKNEAAEAAAEQNPPAAKALPPTSPVENKRPAEPTCDAHCQAAKKREEADLKAQQSMAISAEDLVVITWWQFWLGAAGIGLLVGTLVYTRKAAAEAARAAKAGIDAVGAMRRSERAYVTMSHTSPPGLDIREGGHAAFKIEVRNYGRTPATVTDILLQLDWFGEETPAPERPVYRTDTPRKKVGAFLVAQNYFFYADSLPIPDDGGGGELWLYGYVDYIDEFGQCHRGGYARAYSPERKKNNLVFIDKVGWNYDSPRLADGGDNPKDNEPN